MNPVVIIGWFPSFWRRSGYQWCKSLVQYDVAQQNVRLQVSSEASLKWCIPSSPTHVTSVIRSKNLEATLFLTPQSTWLLLQIVLTHHNLLSSYSLFWELSHPEWLYCVIVNQVLYPYNHQQKKGDNDKQVMWVHLCCFFWLWYRYK